MAVSDATYREHRAALDNNTLVPTRADLRVAINIILARSSTANRQRSTMADEEDGDADGDDYESLNTITEDGHEDEDDGDEDDGDEVIDAEGDDEGDDDDEYIP